MSRVEQLESTSQANFKDKDAPQALGSWKEYEALRFLFPMHQAALFNDCDVVAEYLHCKRGCYRIDINASDNCGRTIAHICAMEGHLVLLLFIIDRRPNLEIKDCDGWTALHWATELPIARALLNAGCHINPRNHAGWTPLHVACRNSNKEITELLLDEGADPNNPDAVKLFQRWRENCPSRNLTTTAEGTDCQDSCLCT